MINGFNYNKEQYAFVFDDVLLAQLKAGDREAIFKMGTAAFDADKLGYAMSFFKLAEREGHPEAAEFINLIREIAKRKSNSRGMVA